MTLLLTAYPNASHFYETDGLFSNGTPPWYLTRNSTVMEPTMEDLDDVTPHLSDVAPDPDAQARSRAAYQSFAKWDPLAIWVYQSWIWRSFSTTEDLVLLAHLMIRCQPCVIPH